MFKLHTPVSITLSEESTSVQPSLSPSANDYNKKHQALYISDRFAVSDEVYHNFSIVSTLPPIYNLKQACSDLNKSLYIRRIEGPFPGAYRPLNFKDTLKAELQKMVRFVPCYLP